MRLRLFALMAVMGLQGCAPVATLGQTVAPAADLRRPTMPVTDLDASVAFFTEVLALKESGRTRYDSPVLRKAIGAAPGVPITVVALDDLNQSGALVLVSAPGLKIAADSNRTNATTLAWSVTDVDAVYRRARAGGYEILMSPQEAAEAEDFPPEKEMVVVEPSGHRLIIVQPPE